MAVVNQGVECENKCVHVADVGDGGTMSNYAFLEEQTRNIKEKEKSNMRGKHTREWWRRITLKKSTTRIAAMVKALNAGCRPRRRRRRRWRSIWGICPSRRPFPLVPVGRADLPGRRNPVFLLVLVLPSAQAGPVGRRDRALQVGRVVRAVLGRLARRALPA
jgi:hypothetical protein